MVFRGKLNKVEMAKQTGIGKSAFTQNPALADTLMELEDYLNAVSIYPRRKLVKETFVCPRCLSVNDKHQLSLS